MVNLVILPGMDGSGLMLEPFISALGPSVNVTVICYPGDQPLDYDGLEAIARAALPDESPFFILGESFSGPIAVSLALIRRPKVTGLILSCSFVRNPRPAFAWLKPFIPLLPNAAVRLSPVNRMLFGAHATGASRAMLARTLAGVSPDVLRARLRAVLAVDVSMKLASLDVPILYLHATDDQVVPRTAADLAATLNPRTQVIALDGPHFLLQTAPVAAATVVANFMGRHATMAHA